MKTLAEITEEHAPLPLGTQIQNLQTNGGGNVHDIARGIAARSCPLDELPEWMRGPRAEWDAAKAAEAEKSRKYDERLRDWETYQNLLNQISDRRKHLAFAEERLSLAKSAVAQLQSNFVAIQRIGEPGSWVGAVEVIRDALVCRELVKLLPVWIERETAAIEELEQQAEALAKRYDV